MTIDPFSFTIRFASATVCPFLMCQLTFVKTKFVESQLNVKSYFFFLSSSRNMKNLGSIQINTQTSLVHLILNLFVISV